MALHSSGSLESIMLKNQSAYGGGHNQIGNLQSIMKSQFDLVDDDEPSSVLELSQCISPPLQPEVYHLQQQQQAAALAEFEQNQAQLLQQQIFQQQQMFQWQQNQLWEHQQWEQQQAEIAEMQYLQNTDRQNGCSTGLEGSYTADSYHMPHSSWDVNYNPYQSNGGDDTMIQSLHPDPWVDLQQQENVFGSHLMQGLPCLEDPLILENWMTSCSGDSSSSVSTEVDSSSSQSFLIPDEHEALVFNSSKQRQQQHQQQQMSRCPSTSSVAAPEMSELVDRPIDDKYHMLATDNFNSTSSPMCVDIQSSMEDIKPSSNWFLPGIQDTIGPPVQQLPPSPSPMASFSPHRQHRPSIMSKNPSSMSTFQMSSPASDPMIHNEHHQMSNKGNFTSAHPAASTTEIRPSSRMFETPEPVTSRPNSMDAPAAVEAVIKPITKLYGPVRPTSHSLGAGDCLYSRSLSDPTMSRRRSESTANQRADPGHMPGQRTGSSDHNFSSRGPSMGGAGRVVTLAELTSGGVKMGGVQLPTVCTQIPSVVRLAVETQASGMGGVRMVQVLLACAEAVACRDSRQANILLQQLQHMGSAHGDAMQRITACFVEGLSARLASTGAQPFKFTNARRNPPSNSDKREGFNLVHRSSPYVAFGHFAANSAILEAFEGEERMHIVDLGMTHSLQWPDLIHGLAKRPSGPPKLLRITGFGLSVESMKEAGEELSRVAAEAKVPFQFRAVEGPLEEMQKKELELREGEALAVNSVLQLHCVVKESRGSLNAVLQSIHYLSPKILTLVEQDASHNGPFFLGRFMEALHYYSAIFDSLDAILPRNSEQRVKMEQFHFAQEIKNIVSCEGPGRVERHERVDQWRRRMSRAGFQTLPLKFLSQAKLWLGLYSCEGYTLSEEKGCLVLGWKGKPIIMEKMKKQTGHRFVALRILTNQLMFVVHTCITLNVLSKHKY